MRDRAERRGGHRKVEDRAAGPDTDAHHHARHRRVQGDARHRARRSHQAHPDNRVHQQETGNRPGLGHAPGRQGLHRQACRCERPSRQDRRPRLITAAHPNSTSASAAAPGSAWTQRILRLAVKPPNTPAMMTQPRKKILIEVPASPSTRPHPSPVATKPLYRPWFAASAFEALAKSGVMPNVRRPRGRVQRNISRTRNPKCRIATSATAVLAMVVMEPLSSGKPQLTRFYL